MFARLSSSLSGDSGLCDHQTGSDGYHNTSNKPLDACRNSAPKVLLVRSFRKNAVNDQTPSIVRIRCQIRSIRSSVDQIRFQMEIRRAAITIRPGEAANGFVYSTSHVGSRQTGLITDPSSGAPVGVTAAVSAVPLFHTGSSPLAGGYLGWICSSSSAAFLITGILLAEAGRRDRIALGAFWLRRARRLHRPAATASRPGGVRLFLATEAAQAWRADILAALTIRRTGGEIAQSGDYFAQFGPESPVLHTWSLAIEEQYYLLFAVFMAVVARRRVGRRWLLVLLLVATGSHRDHVSVDHLRDLAWAYYGTVPRLQALLIGAMLAVLLRAGPGPAVLEKWRDPAGVLGLVGLAVLLAGVWPLPSDARTPWWRFVRPR